MDEHTNDTEIKNVGNKTDLTVQKSYPLFDLWRSTLTLPELKILDTYLACINSHDPERKTVVFSKGELEKLLGVKKIKMEELYEKLTNLSNPVSYITEDDEKRTIGRICLFDHCFTTQESNGKWTFSMTASSAAMEYFFNVESIRYLKYKLKCVTSLTSRYSYVLYHYLKQNLYKETWTVPIEELKKEVACDGKKTKKEDKSSKNSENNVVYNQYKHFNDKVLKKAQAEINEKTDIRFEYEPVKTGRVVTAVRFKVKALPEPDLDALEESGNIIDEPKQKKETESPFPESPSVPVVQMTKETDTGMEEELWESTVSEFGFTPEQMAELREVLVCVPTCRLPEDDVSHTDAVDIRRYHYMRQNVAKLKAQPDVKNPFAYLVKMIKQDAA